jgi:hypothetical protein
MLGNVGVREGAWPSFDARVAKAAESSCRCRSTASARPLTRRPMPEDHLRELALADPAVRVLHGRQDDPQGGRQGPL